MIYNGKNPIKMDDLGGKPTIFGNIHMDNFVVHAYGVPSLDAFSHAWYNPRSICSQNCQIVNKFVVASSGSTM